MNKLVFIACWWCAVVEKQVKYLNFSIGAVRPSLFYNNRFPLKTERTGKLQKRNNLENQIRAHTFH